jgi:hypothetical protein
MKLLTIPFSILLLFSCSKSQTDLQTTDLVGRWVDTGTHQAWMGTDTFPTTFTGMAYNLYPDGRFDVDDSAPGLDFYEHGTWEFIPVENKVNFTFVAQPPFDTLVISNPLISKYYWKDISIENDLNTLTLTSVYEQANMPIGLANKQRVFIRE